MTIQFGVDSLSPLGSSMRYAFSLFRELTWMELCTPSQVMTFGTPQRTAQSHTIGLKSGAKIKIRWNLSPGTPNVRQETVRLWLEDRFSKMAVAPLKRKKASENKRPKKKRQR